MNYKLAQLSLAPNQRGQSTSEIFVAQPDLNKEDLLGRLFVLLEIHSKDNSTLRLANFLISELNKNYYQNDKAIMRERVGSITIEQVFESCLAKTNKSLFDQISARRFEINFNSFNCLIGVVHDQGLHFSNIGKNRFFIIHKNKPAQNAPAFKIKEITSQFTEETAAEFNYQKIFSNLSSGQMPLGGYLLFTNEALPEYISSAKLLEVVSTLPPLGAMEQIKSQLEKLNSFISFQGILIKNTLGKPKAEPPKPKPKIAHESISNLRITEAETEKLLTPAGLIDFKGWFGRSKKAFALSKSRSAVLMLASKNVVKEKLPAKKRRGLLWLNKLKNQLLGGIGLVAVLMNRLPQLAKLLSDRQKLKHQGQLIFDNGRTLAWQPIAWFKKMSLKNRSLISLSLIFFILFFGSLEIAKQKNNRLASAELYQETKNQIEQKENQIEANLIPKNYSGAKILAAEAKLLIDSLMVTEERFLEIEGIKNKFANLEEKIRQASEAKTELIVDLASNNQAAKPDNINLYKNNLYLADSESKTIYKIDLATKKTDSYDQGLEKTARLDLVAQSEKLLYFWSGQDIFIYNLDKLDGEHYTVNGLASTSEISGLGVFGGKVYIFDGNSSQLYRLSYANGRFANPVSWFKNKPSADNLKNFYLDGNAYLLFDDRLEKYAKGNKQNFALANPEPPIKRLTAMISGEQHLYLADPENKRLLIFKNNGQLERQLENELLGEVSALALNEQAKKIYALSGQKIYSISLEAK